MNFHSPHNNLTRNIDCDYIDFKYLREIQKTLILNEESMKIRILNDDLEKELFFDTEL